MEERDYLAENAAYLKKDLGKNNISQNLFQRFKELITNGQLPAGYMMPNENVVSEQLGIGRSTLREAYTARRFNEEVEKCANSLEIEEKECYGDISTENLLSYITQTTDTSDTLPEKDS